MTPTKKPIRAAGTVPWRRRDGRLEVALVHRPRYDDWSWPKGKLEPGEASAVAAVRETAEETGLQVRLGRPLPSASYGIRNSSGRPTTKEVRYWAGQVVGGEGALLHEIDELVWLQPKAARQRLDYPHDREQLAALVKADRSGRLGTWAFAIVRHAQARRRSTWSRRDLDRPLTPGGTQQARAATAALTAYQIERLVSSPALRCVTTLAPYAEQQGLAIERFAALSEEHFHSRGGAKGAKIMRRLLADGMATAVCGHGPVLPSMIRAIRAQVAPAKHQIGDVSAALADAAEHGLTKGEIVVLHVSGTGRAARIVAVDRIPPVPARR